MYLDVMVKFKIKLITNVSYNILNNMIYLSHNGWSHNISTRILFWDLVSSLIKMFISISHFLRMNHLLMNERVLCFIFSSNYYIRLCYFPKKINARIIVVGLIKVNCFLRNSFVDSWRTNKMFIGFCRINSL